MRTLGKKAGIATYLLDAFKAVIADILIHFLIVPHTAIPGNASVSVLWPWNCAWT